MNLEQLLEKLKHSDRFKRCVTRWEVIPPKAAEYEPFPDYLDKRLILALNKKGIHSLYSHQAIALDEVTKGNSVVVVTPTASGKTLCYNLPVLNAILQDKNSRAIYLFPTKALSQDQVAELMETVEAMGEDIKTFTYDGDTPPSARVAIRKDGHIIVTNPDMLHTGILPHHTKWIKLFSNLKYVVIDEVHTYRGVFGSHTANVLRRLHRICRFYGSNPVFICCSATIANPKELAEKLTGRQMVLIDRSGAPSGEKNVIFYNPPVVNRQLGIRKSSLLEAKNLALDFLKNGIKTIVFARSRLAVEVMLTYLKEGMRDTLKGSDSIRGYRGGYLPRERREIEKGLRENRILGVVSTNALELGIDIGGLDVSIITGYPGSIASTWQQAGRAGRRSAVSASILVASSSPLDQYIINHPDYFFGSPPESGLINPDNLYILVSHIKCAAFELPFEDGEKFGVETTEEILSFLESEKILRHVGGRWHWMADAFPAEEISLRSASTENFVVVDITEEPRVIGEVDRASAPMLIHEEAIYIHGGQQYQVEKLDYEEKKAYVRKVDVDYYTDANLAVEIKVLDVLKEQHRREETAKYFGEVLVTSLATMFKKIKFFTHENVGSGPIHLPPEEMHTTAFWFTVPETVRGLTAEDLRSGLAGLCNVLVNIAPLYLMCDPRDIRGVIQVRSPFTQKPTIFIYDAYPGGVGFAERLYQMDTQLLKAARQVILECGCDDGCPSCVGPLEEVGPGSKASALKLIQGVLFD
ncbi:DEAD/DEAH box helicase [Thermosediminibacter oceani]|uniref:DEAD/DEAH box helicase domain protein n=1 Tax=Thermosediminibacter oceani (strain ATCC BAA-1034 / DSM 16646 / JW/IW-1228P) TaxID=555079 RepID=D9S2F6_THEOJ|nr:DEAD/DEAH box helicase [Thermosediminibacter oceani]ADL07583.1 DEAD/DEAH box helicase domain protein [Thermosediminibacter oceani DSM 16646]